jgi:hypothetical protein
MWLNCGKIQPGITTPNVVAINAAISAYSIKSCPLSLRQKRRKQKVIIIAGRLYPLHSVPFLII